MTSTVIPLYNCELYTSRCIDSILRRNPLDWPFCENYKLSTHKKGVRQFLSSWHKRRTTGAFTAHKSGIGIEHFLKTFAICPFQKKLYTSFICSITSAVSGMTMNEMDEFIARHKGRTTTNEIKS